MNRRNMTPAQAREHAQRHGLAFDPEKDKARQEKKDEADINVILKKFGVQPSNRTPLFTEVDYDLTLQSALDATHQAKEAYSQMPRQLRDKYPTWQSFLTALDAGAIEIKIGDPPEPPKPPETT